MLIYQVRAAPRPFAGVRAGMGGFATVIEAEGASARFAAKGEEVELAAEGHLAVRADGFDVSYGHGGVGCCVLVRVRS